MRRFRFAHIDEDADDGSDLILRLDGSREQKARRRRRSWTCAGCLHLNPGGAKECEDCGRRRREE